MILTFIYCAIFYLATQNKYIYAERSNFFFYLIKFVGLLNF